MGDRRNLRFAAVLAAILASLLILASTAFAALTATPTRTFPIGGWTYGGYAPGFDGTFWRVIGGSGGLTVSHFDDEGNDLGDGFSNSLSYPLGIAYYGGRVYIPNAGSQRIVSYNTSGGEALGTDSETNSRIGSNQVILRSYPSGLGTLGFGQNAKVASFDLTKNVVGHPWYPQAFHGNGINDPSYKVEGNSFETCSLDGEGIVVGEPDPYCGKYWYTDTGDGTHPGFNYAIDTAAGLGGMYVADYHGNKITHINTVANPGATIDLVFGVGPGSGAGQLERPYSVVVQPGTGNVYVSEEANRRISVFSPGGAFIAAFGYGVLDGEDEMQVCGVGIGACRAGVAYQSDSRSYFTRLDFGSETELLAYMPLLDQVQVFSLGSGPGPGAQQPTPQLPAGGGGGGEASASGDIVRLSARPLKVEKGAKTTLTGIVNRGKSCANRKVLFQHKEPRSWDNLGSSLKAGKGCKAVKRVKVTAKSVFRAVLIDSRNQATLAYSPKVTVKLKSGR